MPWTFAIATITALSMAGIPLLNGFLSKEMMLYEASHTEWWHNPWVVPVLATIGAVFSAAYSFRYIWHVFFGPVRDDYPHTPHDPGAGFLFSPAFLTVLVVLIGVMPYLAEPLVRVTSAAVIGGALPDFHLELWHGLNAAVFMSIIAVVGGAVLLALHAPLDRLWIAAPRPEAKVIFDWVVGRCAAGAEWLTGRLHDGSLTRYAAIFVVTVVALGAHAFWTGGTVPPTRELMALSFLPAVGWVMLVAAAGCIVAFHRNRLLALVLMGVVGLVVSIGFAYLSAPDLALTQISVEVVTILLLLLALNFLPNETPIESTAARRLRDGVISVVAGLGAGLLIHALLVRDFSQPTISAYHLENSYTGGGGDNVVNVILVDFRGFDTFGEIIVLGIAALVIFAVTEALLDGPVRRRLLNWVPDLPRAGDAHPLMMVVSTRVMMPIVLLVGFYIFWRGHNLPGGGFISGLVVAIAVVMQYMASGFAWADARQRFPYHGIIGAGVLVAGLTGVGAWFAGKPFLTSGFDYFRIPPFNEFELATAVAFDLGVFLAVVGAVLLSLESFSRLARRSGEEVSEHAMDIDPSREEED